MSEASRRYRPAEFYRLADVQPYILKVWEREFPMLAAHRSPTGPQFYTEEELEIVKRIKHLLYDEQYTIAGACKRLIAEQARAAGASAPLPAPDEAEETEVPAVAAAPKGVVLPEPSGGEEAAAAEPEGQEPDEQPLLVPVPVEPAPKPRRSRAKAAPSSEEQPSLQATEPESVDRVEAPVVKRADPRVARTITELKEILDLLSRDL